MYFHIILTLVLAMSQASLTATGRPKVGIIGAGIGGTSSAYFLNELFKHNVDITIFEKHVVGGRLHNVQFAGTEYEQGGSVIHPRNKYMMDFVNKLGLSHRPNSDKESDCFVLFDGKDVVFESSTWSVVTFAKLLYRYGLDIFRIEGIITKMLDSFERIYDLQAGMQAYSTVEQLLSAMDSSFVNMTRHSTEEGLRRDGLNEKIIEEFVLAITRVNYCQSTQIQQFVGGVSVAGASPNLWSVKGGNQLVPSKLLKVTKAQLKKCEVTEVQLMQTGKYNLTYNCENEENPTSEVFDIVIIATPLTSDTSNLKFSNFPSVFQFPGKYHQTVATFVQGKLNTKLLGYENEKITEIFTVNNDLFFTTVGKNTPVDDDENNNDPDDVYKVFSNNVLTDSELKTLFTDIKSVDNKVWLAYPEYASNSKLGSFLLHSNLYHINAIEWAASAMEMSCIGAKNVALLAYQRWNNRRSNNAIDDSDYEPIKKRVKNEL